MIYFLIIFVVVVATLLMFRLRVRFEIANGHRVLFVGLGRSGPELDFADRRGVFRLFGVRVKTFDMDRDKPEERKPKAKVIGEKKKPKLKRTRPLKDIVQILPQCSRALWRYAFDLLKSLIVEQAEGQIEAGFDSPDLTGRAFGYYQAALAAVPSVVGRVHYTPDWNGSSFSGAMQVAVALPLYRLLILTLVLIWRLPVRKVIKLAIGEKKGVQDGQQRS